MYVMLMSVMEMYWISFLLNIAGHLAAVTQVSQCCLPGPGDWLVASDPSEAPSVSGGSEW